MALDCHCSVTVGASLPNLGGFLCNLQVKLLNYTTFLHCTCLVNNELIYIKIDCIKKSIKRWIKN